MQGIFGQNTVGLVHILGAPSVVSSIDCPAVNIAGVVGRRCGIIRIVAECLHLKAHHAGDVHHKFVGVVRIVVISKGHGGGQQVDPRLFHIAQIIDPRAQRIGAHLHVATHINHALRDQQRLSCAVLFDMIILIIGVELD